MHREELQLREAKPGDSGQAVAGGEFAQAVEPQRLQRLKLRRSGDQAAAGLVNGRLDAPGHCVQQRVVGSHAGVIGERAGDRQS